MSLAGKIIGSAIKRVGSEIPVFSDIFSESLVIPKVVTPSEEIIMDESAVSFREMRGVPKPLDQIIKQDLPDIRNVIEKIKMYEKTDEKRLLESIRNFENAPLTEKQLQSFKNIKLLKNMVQKAPIFIGAMSASALVLLMFVLITVGFIEYPIAFRNEFISSLKKDIAPEILSPEKEKIMLKEFEKGTFSDSMSPWFGNPVGYLKQI